MKKVLIDLSALNNVNCGFGQIALNYGEYFKNSKVEGWEIYLLVPSSFVNAFGNNVKYVVAKKIYRIFPFLMPASDIWYTTQQRSRFRPSDSSSKSILTIHDLNFLYETDDIDPKKGAKRLQQKINRADIIVAISDYTRKDILKHLNTEGKEVRVIYNGVKYNDFIPDKTPDFIKDNQQKFFFTIGEIRTKKNFHVLLDLMKICPEFHLYIAGNEQGTYADSIKDRIMTENIHNVTILGPVSEEHKIWLYNNCYAFLFPSLVEGFGLPVIEAMNYGKPVISSGYTSLTEIGSTYAYYWDNFEPQYMKLSMYKYLEEFYSDERNRQKLIQYARTFTYDKHMQSYFQLFNELLA